MAAAAMAVGATAGAARPVVEHMVGGWRQRRHRRPHCRRHCLLRQAAPLSSVYRTLSLMRAGRDLTRGRG